MARGLTLIVGLTMLSGFAAAQDGADEQRARALLEDGVWLRMLGF